MKPSELLPTLQALIPTKQSILLKGPPGTGKSSIVWQAASAIWNGATTASTVGGLPDVDWFNVIRATDRDPVDLRGIPYQENGCTLWAKPDLIAALTKSPAGVICIEELPQATPAVQCVLRELLLDRRIGGHKIPEDWCVIATGNRQEDRAGAGRLLSHVASSVIILDIEVSVDDWQNWALAAGIAPDIRAFIRFRPSLLWDFDPIRERNADPRAYERLSRVIDKVPQYAQLPVAAGCLGDGPAAEFLAFRQLYLQLPDPAVILANPTGTTVPTEPAVVYALIGALTERARAATDKELGALAQFAGRLSGEFGTLLMRDSLAVNPRFATLPTTMAWIRANAHLFAGAA